MLRLGEFAGLLISLTFGEDCLTALVDFLDTYCPLS